ncbi:DNA-binding protein YbaB [Crossiella equi]|uniref:DNA-binding protein YbaB n=1 Tax=Crossiella equi TaxID=130796 RepID=A0ABS5AP20_9PSEU|nr:YbaB/EbfC family nucleoid-associated protein [Crossiella equi]MBP2478301.1 DNA-binding protein YbaB [Crossiella equi]
MERENRARMAQANAISGELAQLSGRASTPDGKISVEVGVNGMLKDIQIHPSLLDASLRNLGSLLVQLAQQAQSSAGRQLEEVVAPVFGEASQTMAMLRGYAPPPVEDEAPPNQPPPAPRQQPPQARPQRSRFEEDDDEDFGGPVLR